MIMSPLSISESGQQAFDAAHRGDLNALRALVDKSFHLEECDHEGNSILHAAVQGGNLEMVRFLVLAGAMDPTWANREMITPFDLARSTGATEIEAFFEKICGFSLEQTYRNPICTGMYPDPSILRVGDDYYMVNSSFLYFPCIPISHSRDLVHWELIGHAVTDPAWAQEMLGPLQCGRGFWAPDISYHNGRFYICATLRMNDDASCIQMQMVTSADRPEGPYETPVLHAVPGIDPSLFTDSDGRRYMLLNRGARLMEISEDGKKILSEPELIWYGWDKHGPEGPHLLKKDGWYYCFLAEGGTGKGHMITVARSRSLRGPYQPSPYNPLLHQKDSAGVLQCCGHGKPVQTADGRWFIVYLCSRLLDDQWGMLGRETCLDELTWTPDGWPVVNQGKGPSTLAPKPLPDVPCRRISPWMAPRCICDDRIFREGERVTIHGDGTDLCDTANRSLLVKRQLSFSFKVVFRVRISSLAAGEDAGLALYYDENSFVKFGLSEDEVFAAEYLDDQYVRTVCKPRRKQPVHTLEIETENLKRRFLLDGEPVACFDRVTSLCSEGLQKGKRFTGATYGVYVHGKQTVIFEEVLDGTET